MVAKKRHVELSEVLAVRHHMLSLLPLPTADITNLSRYSFLHCPVEVLFLKTLN